MQSFPAMNKVTLLIFNESCGAYNQTNPILKHLQDVGSSVKFLTVVFNNCEINMMSLSGFLLSIIAHVQLDEVRIKVRNDEKPKNGYNFVFNWKSVGKLIQTCRNLQVIRFGN